VLDGHRIDLGKLLEGPVLFDVRHIRGRSGPARVAAVGTGLLLRGLSRGTHTLRAFGIADPGGPIPTCFFPPCPTGRTVAHTGRAVAYTYTIHVR
jgi:hypothetical protein